jgi:hypothetical protein
LRIIIKEVLLRQSAVEREVPHKAKEDDWYEGVFIPKGAPYMANCQHMTL